MRLWDSSFKFLTDFKVLVQEFYYPGGKKKSEELLKGVKQQEQKVGQTVVTTELSASQ